MNCAGTAASSISAFRGARPDEAVHWTGCLFARHRLALGEVPGWGITQVNIHDPDGNHLHVDFQEPMP